MRYVFDLDLTLCNSSESRYELSEPWPERIAFVNAIYKEGHEVIVFTARGMSSFSGNRWLAQIRWRRITEAQLRNWGLNYHKLILGKPAGDIYVDDKGVKADDFFPTENRALSD